ncbi:hypothetical protein EXIGLDRAFT_593407, partial [Exidia glandulosa HHB12029]
MLRNSGITGYNIPGLKANLIASLYADDTTVYLSESDSYATLLGILQVWQRAAGAKFNVAKTEIIPLGTPEFRERLIRTRLLYDDDTEIAAHIRIARDGEATRILGTWPGNKVDGPGLWAPILEKITKKLDAWSKLNPTIDGRCTIVQIYHRVVFLMHYLTAAQGMPRSIELKLNKIISDFIWAG